MSSNYAKSPLLKSPRLGTCCNMLKYKASPQVPQVLSKETGKNRDFEEPGLSCLRFFRDAKRGFSEEFMKKQNFKEWQITFKDSGNGWINIFVSRNIDQGKRQMKGRKGQWITRPATRSKFTLGWDGERFAESHDLLSMQRGFKGLFEVIKEALSG